MHVVAPLVRDAVPSGQLMQGVPPVEYVPARQVLHEAAPSSDRGSSRFSNYLRLCKCIIVEESARDKRLAWVVSASGTDVTASRSTDDEALTRITSEDD